MTYMFEERDLTNLESTAPAKTKNRLSEMLKDLERLSTDRFDTELGNSMQPWFCLRSGSAKTLVRLAIKGVKGAGALE
jgi:hypothetical protein